MLTHPNTSNRSRPFASETLLPQSFCASGFTTIAQKPQRANHRPNHNNPNTNKSSRMSAARATHGWNQ
jgi:hypothetical protein